MQNLILGINLLTIPKMSRGANSYGGRSTILVLLIQIAFLCIYGYFLYYINPDPEHGYQSTENCQIVPVGEAGCGTCYGGTADCCQTCQEVIMSYQNKNWDIKDSNLQSFAQCANGKVHDGIIEYTESGLKEVCPEKENTLWWPFCLIFTIIDALVMILFWFNMTTLGAYQLGCATEAPPPETQQQQMKTASSLLMVDLACTLLLEFGFLMAYFLDPNLILVNRLTLLISTQVIIGLKFLYYCYSGLVFCKYKEHCCFKSPSIPYSPPYDPSGGYGGTEPPGYELSRSKKNARCTTRGHPL